MRRCTYCTKSVVVEISSAGSKIYLCDDHWRPYFNEGLKVTVYEPTEEELKG